LRGCHYEVVNGGFAAKAVHEILDVGGSRRLGGVDVWGLHAS
jgi:hypothetical protein